MEKGLPGACGGGGVIYPFVQVLGSSQELVGWRLNFLFTCWVHTFLQLQRGRSYPQSCRAVLTALVPAMQSFCSLLKCQTSWRAIVTDLDDLSETLHSYLLLLPPFLFNVCFILFCLCVCERERERRSPSVAQNSVQASCLIPKSL